jgi:hypothetical protein
VKTWATCCWRCDHDFSAHYPDNRSVKKTYQVISDFIGCFDGIPLSNQTAMASPWAVEKFETYQLHPAWVNTRCQNMEKVNQKGLSNFTEKVSFLEKEYNSNFSAQSTKEIIEFY